MSSVRLAVMAVVAMAVAGSAAAQVAWLGANAGATWTWEGERSALVRGKDSAWGVWFGVPLDGETVLRLRGNEMPVAGVEGGGRLRAATVGVDYFFPGVLGEALFSAGLGGYQRRLTSPQFDSGEHGRWELGWYLGIGEWFSLTRRTRLTLEISWDRSRHSGTPTLATAWAGLAVSL